MTLHPITVVDHVLEEYRSYLSTEFRASDEKLRESLEEALEQPGFLAQEPFFQAHRPFKSGKDWSELGLDAPLAKVMKRRSGSETAYLHQSEAISHLLSERGRAACGHHRHRLGQDRVLSPAGHPERHRGLGSLQAERA